MFSGYVSQTNLLIFCGYVTHELFNKVDEMNH